MVCWVSSGLVWAVLAPQDLTTRGVCQQPIRILVYSLSVSFRCSETANPPTGYCHENSERGKEKKRRKGDKYEKYEKCPKIKGWIAEAPYIVCPSVSPVSLTLFSLDRILFSFSFSFLFASNLPQTKTSFLDTTKLDGRYSRVEDIS